MMQYSKRINRSIECISLILADIRLSPRTVLGLLLHVYWVIMQYFKRFSRSIECISLILHTTHTHSRYYLVLANDRPRKVKMDDVMASLAFRIQSISSAC